MSTIAVAACGIAALVTSLAAGQPAPQSAPDLAHPRLAAPIWVYNNWSAYDELSDDIPLTEELAMRELAEIERYRRLGVRFDSYLMDAFWFAPDGGYRTWRKPNWPNGPDRWLAECKRQGVKPGLWFGCNSLVKIDAAPAWQDSLNAKKTHVSFADGGFLADFMDMLDYWYDRGVRQFKFDFADFSVAMPDAEKKFTPEEIAARNQAAFRAALVRFRNDHPEALLECFNGFGGDQESTAGPFPFKNAVDLRWLEALDAMYSGDPRPSDVPQANFWRSVDIYCDHMVRRYRDSGLPLERIDATEAMIGRGGTTYYRKTAAWRGMMLLTVARGGWFNTLHGNLEYLDDDDVRWLARLQSMFTPLQTNRRTAMFGGVPGDSEPYGYASSDAAGAVYTVVNPSERVAAIELPPIADADNSQGEGRVIFTDAGFVPVLAGHRITLGPGQLTAVGYGRYAKPEFDLGVQRDVVIPASIEPLKVRVASSANNAVEAIVDAPPRGDLRIIVRQRDAEGAIRRTWVEFPPKGPSFADVFKLTAVQDGSDLAIELSHGRKIWSGLSWAAGEIRRGDLAGSRPITIRCQSADKEPVTLEVSVFAVEY